jgi:hypothetical protein
MKSSLIPPCYDNSALANLMQVFTDISNSSIYSNTIYTFLFLGKAQQYFLRYLWVHRRKPIQAKQRRQTHQNLYL